MSKGNGMDALPGRAHYIKGNDPAKWRTNVTAYASLRYGQIYPGVDLIYRASGPSARRSEFEYDFLVAPGADPSAILIEFHGADRMEIDTEGNLALRIGKQLVQHRKPRVFQDPRSAKPRREVPASFAMDGLNRVRFQIGEHDRSLPLVIDPVISSSTFLGGEKDDGAFAVTTDSSGNIYVAGITGSTSFPAIARSTPGGRLNGDRDAFVMKLNPTATQVLYATYLGGSDDDTAMSIAVDSSGSAYVAGGTISADSPVTTGAAQTRYGGTGGSSMPPFSSPSGDAFAAKLNPSGTLAYATYLGGSSIDHGYGIAVDSTGAAVVAGATGSSNFPVTAGVVQATGRGSADVFVTRINPAGTGFVYSTYLGGSDEDYAFALALDASGNAYLSGATASDDFPVTPGAFLPSTGPRDIATFVSKLNSTGTSLVYSTYVAQGFAFGIAVDRTGNAHLTGLTNARNYAPPSSPGTYQWRSKSQSVGWDAFVAKLAPAGDAIAFFSVIGSNGPDFGRAIALDSAGDIYITGETGNVLDFPTTADAVQRCGSGSPSAFVLRLSSTGTTLKYSSYLNAAAEGGSSGMAIAVAPGGRVVVAGSTNAQGFPSTAGTIQPSYAGGSRFFDSDNLYAYAGDAFITQADLSAPSPLALACEANAASLATKVISPGEIVSLFGSGIGPATGVTASLDSDGRLPTVLAGTRAFFDGVAAPLLFVRSDQINTIAPFGLAGKESTQLQIEYAGAKSQVMTVPVVDAHPGIFTVDASGSGQVAALNQDGTYNSEANPAAPGSVVVLFLTGTGMLSPVPEDGRVVQGPDLPRTVPVEAIIGFCSAEILYSGSAPGLIAGAVQVNLRIPDQLPPPFPYDCGRGDAPVVLFFGMGSSQATATVHVRR